jgi:hypothetical protein
MSDMMALAAWSAAVFTLGFVAGFGVGWVANRRRRSRRRFSSSLR